MSIKYVFPFWGSEHLNPNDFLDFAVSNEFDGVEINIPKTARFENSFYEALKEIKQSRPDFICVLQQVFGVKKESPEDYLLKVLERLEKLKKFQPSFINSHTGKDYYSFEDNCKIIEAIEHFSGESGIPVFHEIHRGRFSFHSFSTLKYLEHFPNLKLVGDFSHWGVVSESMLQDQEETITKVIPHISHIHARVGFEQSPQVNNPFAPEWSDYLKQYLKWWQEIVKYQPRSRPITITPEFGPYPYMPQSPFTRESLADQVFLNCKMKEFLKLNLKSHL